MFYCQLNFASLVFIIQHSMIRFSDINPDQRKIYLKLFSQFHSYWSYHDLKFFSLICLICYMQRERNYPIFLRQILSLLSLQDISDGKSSALREDLCYTYSFSLGLFTLFTLVLQIF